MKYVHPSIIILCLETQRLPFFAGQDFQCPEKFGYFEDLSQCDKYYICREGRATPTLCPDGLVFDPYSRKQIPCDHYFNIDCGDRTDLRK